MRESKGKGFADFGGKRELVDERPMDTAIREANEESNKIFSIDFLKANLSYDRSIFISSSKYLLFIQKVQFVDPAKFGTLEEHMQEEHSV